MTIPQALVKLSRSKFRGRFKLNAEMQEIVRSSGVEKIRQFAAERIAKAVNLIMAWIEMQMNGGIAALEASMTPEELAAIPFYQGTKKYECPYRKTAAEASLSASAYARASAYAKLRRDKSA